MATTVKEGIQLTLEELEKMIEKSEGLVKWLHQEAKEPRPTCTIDGSVEQDDSVPQT